MAALSRFLLGEALFGDDFSDEQLKKWFDEETNAYYDIHVDGKKYCYQFHAVDKLYGFKFIHTTSLNVLGIGSADGAEFLPIWDKIKNLTILENSDKYGTMLVDQARINYLRAHYKGAIEAPDNTFDVVVCYSALHHIANVSFVMSEVTRVMRKGGLALIREPIISMGDWSQPRPGLTKNERGIPLKIFREIIQKSGLIILSEKIWNIRPLAKLLFFYRGSIFNNALLTRLDVWFAGLFCWNIHYYSRYFFHKIAPSAVFYVLKKI